MTTAGRAAPQRFPRAARRAGLAPAVALAGALAAPPAAGPAAADGPAELWRERDRIAAQLAQVRGPVPLIPGERATVEEPPARPGQPPAAPLQAPALPVDETRLAGFQVRLGQLEEELRRLTGRIERLEFEQRRVNERLDRLIADLDLRLGMLEAALPGDRVAAPAPEEGLAAAPPLPEPDEEPAPPAAAATTGGADDAGDPIARYHAAVDLLRAGDYAAAEAAMEAFLGDHPDHELAANAAYWLGETYYVRRNYADAAATFARNYRTYGAESSKAPDNLLKLGMALEALGDSERACEVFAELGRAFPAAPAHIDQAVAREQVRAGCT